MFLLAIYLNTDMKTLNFYLTVAREERNDFIYYYGFVAIFVEILILPIHIFFGFIIRKYNLGKNLYRGITKIIFFLTLRKWFLLIGEMVKK